jgi:hypothetical protein
MWSVWLRFFLQTISIVRYKILQLEVEKHHFILIIGPHVSKYIFQAQYSPKWPWNFRANLTLFEYTLIISQWPSKCNFTKYITLLDEIKAVILSRVACKEKSGRFWRCTYKMPYFIKNSTQNRLVPDNKVAYWRW